MTVFLNDVVDDNQAPCFHSDVQSQKGLQAGVSSLTSVIHTSPGIASKFNMSGWSTFLDWAQGALSMLLASSLLLYWYIRIPGDMPKNIPVVPIYISLLGLWTDMGQDEIFDRWLREP